MRSRQNMPLIFGLFVVLVVTALLVGGGIYVRSVVGGTFRDTDRIRDARSHVNDMLRHQLDEETGVRGYAVTHLPILLQPYYGGRASLPLDFDRVRAELQALHATEALPTLHDAGITNYRWVHEVAFPLIFKPGRHTALELRGKRLVDRFRVDASSIYADLTRRTAIVNARANRALVLVGALAVAGILAVAVAALIFTLQQFRLWERLERERGLAEEERRKSAVLSAAYEAERRIVETFREAFAKPALPALTRVTLSAAFEATSEEAGVGGDWFDVLELSDSRGLLVVGDAAGHGIDAVVAMERARQALISCALVDSGPDQVLARANATLIGDRSRMVTALVVLIDGGGCRFSYAAAGHPPPILVETGLRPRLLEFGALPLGVMFDTHYRLHKVQTAPGAMLVLYTDGAIESSRDVAAGETQLLEAVESAIAHPTLEPAKSISDAIAGSHRRTDDVTILTVRFD
ncbi:MAG TPA: SpoIIE family protein phosphatase [Candidatus Babeliales bacterium]|nr:SpoIIE family protein phosphatase [Candidatus Babeliales bacterium]